MATTGTLLQDPVSEHSVTDGKPKPGGMLGDSISEYLTTKGQANPDRLADSLSEINNDHSLNSFSEFSDKSYKNVLRFPGEFRGSVSEYAASKDELHYRQEGDSISEVKSISNLSKSVSNHHGFPVKSDSLSNLPEVDDCFQPDHGETDALKFLNDLDEEPEFTSRVSPQPTVSEHEFDSYTVYNQERFSYGCSSPLAVLGATFDDPAADPFGECYQDVAAGDLSSLAARLSGNMPVESGPSPYYETVWGRGNQAPTLLENSADNLKPRVSDHVIDQYTWYNNAGRFQYGAMSPPLTLQSDGSPFPPTPPRSHSPTNDRFDHESAAAPASYPRHQEAITVTTAGPQPRLLTAQPTVSDHNIDPYTESNHERFSYGSSSPLLFDRYQDMAEFVSDLSCQLTTPTRQFPTYATSWERWYQVPTLLENSPGNLKVTVSDHVVDAYTDYNNGDRFMYGTATPPPLEVRGLTRHDVPSSRPLGALVTYSQSEAAAEGDDSSCSDDIEGLPVDFPAEQYPIYMQFRQMQREKTKGEGQPRYRGIEHLGPKDHEAAGCHFLTLPRRPESLSWTNGIGCPMADRRHLVARGADDAQHCPSADSAYPDFFCQDCSACSDNCVKDVRKKVQTTRREHSERLVQAAAPASHGPCPVDDDDGTCVDGPGGLYGRQENLGGVRLSITVTSEDALKGYLSPADCKAAAPLTRCTRFYCTTTDGAHEQD